MLVPVSSHSGLRGSRRPRASLARVLLAALSTLAVVSGLVVVGSSNAEARYATGGTGIYRSS